MRKQISQILSFVVVLILPITLIHAAPFGKMEDTDFANKLWNAMVQSSLVGPNAIYSAPYKGIFPHGEFLDTIDGHLNLGGHTGRLIIKRNYGGKGLTKEMVANRPGRHLKAITVMFKREKGYDHENLNWFWVKFNPVGKVLNNPKGIPLAGRVAKGVKTAGCIACHKGAPGKDMVFNNDR